MPSQHEAATLIPARTSLPQAVLERRASRKAERAPGKGDAAEQAGEGGAPPAAKAGEAAADASNSSSSSDDEDELLYPGKHC